MAGLATVWWAVTLTAQTTTAISAADSKARLFALAHDSMAGRETGSLGDFKATEYLAAEFRRLGLEPVGDGGTYFQAIPFLRFHARETRPITIGGATFRLGPDYLVMGRRYRTKLLDGIVAVASGTTTDSTTWASADQLAGRAAVLFPPAELGRGFGALIGFLQQPRFAKAAAVLIAAHERLPSEAVASVLEGQITTDTTRTGEGPLILVVTDQAARAALGGGGRETVAGTLGGTLSGDVGMTFSPTAYPVRNVVGVLRGADPALKASYVSVTAHHDHVGFDRAPVDHDSLRAVNRVTRPMGADNPRRDPTAAEWVEIRRLIDSLRAVRPSRPDSIRNGADDDGSGTVGVLEVAERLASGPRPRRSILFVGHAAEERGLLGSRWYTDHATVAVDSIVAEMDMDMIGRGGKSDLPEGGPQYLELVGLRRLSQEYGDLFDRVNARQTTPFVFNLSYDRPGHPLQYYCRADHYSYARYGIPAVALSRGEHLDYHQVTDEPQYIDYEALARVATLVSDVATEIANLDHRPLLDQPKRDPNAPCVQ